jgi:2-desacetyl-2-hydroxyethyl bacteriochlorophyllide A dehydrogenase
VGRSVVGACLTRSSVWFTGPRQVAVREEPAPAPGRGEVLVATAVSAISAGTELLVYRGLVPAGMPLDADLAALAGPAAFPLQYGYAAVGVVREAGAGVDPSWVGRRVFAFQPHASCFTSPPGDLVLLPAGLSAETAALLPTLETAVTLLMDGRPTLGERVAVCGQGVVGLATTALLAALPLAALVTLERLPLRRQASLALGATASLDPDAAETPSRLAALLAGDDGPDGADLAFELSGVGAGLDATLALVGFGGRVVVGSWYGREPVALHLGGHFHRGRARLVASQVSTIAPEHSGRWTKARRLQAALRALTSFPAPRLITHRFPVARAAEAYALLDERPGEAIQVLFTYDAGDSAA